MEIRWNWVSEYPVPINIQIWNSWNFKHLLILFPFKIIISVCVCVCVYQRIIPFTLWELTSGLVSGAYKGQAWRSALFTENPSNCYRTTASREMRMNSSLHLLNEQWVWKALTIPFRNTLVSQGCLRPSGQVVTLLRTPACRGMPSC